MNNKLDQLWHYRIASGLRSLERSVGLGPGNMVKNNSTRIIEGLSIDALIMLKYQLVDDE